MPGEPEEFENIDEGNQDEELLLETEVDETDDGGEAADLDDDSVDLVLEGEEVEQVEETPAIRRLRERVRELNRENRQLRGAPVQVPKIEVGPMPTLEDPDVDWDSEKLSKKMEAWAERSVEAKRQQREDLERAENANKAWQVQLQKYEQNKAKLTVPGKDELEEEALSKLSQVQQAIIVKHPRNAEIILALGKYPKRLAALSGVSDPVDFTYAVSDLGRELKVSSKRRAPEPEGIVRGGGQISMMTGNKKLDQLEKEADRTGDRTKLVAYKRELKSKG